MAKPPPPPPDDAPPGTKIPRTRTAELTARATRAAERTDIATRTTVELTTEVLERSQLPVEDETVTERDPRRGMREANPPSSSAKKKEPPADPAQEAEARKAEVILKSFLEAAHARAKDSPKKAKQKEKPKEKEKEKPKEAIPEAEKPKPKPKPARLPPKVTRELPVVSAPPPRPPPVLTRIPRNLNLPPALPLPEGPAAALQALNQAQPPGVFVVEYTGGPDDGSEDPELAQAVEEAIGTLFGVRGIHHIGPGKDDAGTKVVVVAAGDEFGEAALRQIPESVRNFPTLITLPYDILPLRRDR